MRIVPSYSEDSDTAYVSFGDPREVAQTLAPMDDLSIDLDADGRVVGIEFVTASRLLDETTLEDAHLDELIGVTDIARLLDKRKQNVAQYYTARDDFPRPAAVLPTGRYWRRGEVEAWAAAERTREKEHKKARSLVVASEWLTHVLAAGAKSTADLRQAAEAKGLNWSSVRRAAAAIEVERIRKGTRTHWNLHRQHPMRRHD